MTKYWFTTSFELEKLMIAPWGKANSTLHHRGFLHLWRRTAALQPREHHFVAFASEPQNSSEHAGNCLYRVTPLRINSALHFNRWKATWASCRTIAHALNALKIFGTVGSFDSRAEVSSASYPILRLVEFDPWLDKRLFWMALRVLLRTRFWKV